MKKVLLLTILALSASYVNAQWQLTNGPYGGGVTCSCVKGSDIFVGTNNGVYLSSNNGNNWLSRGFVDTVVSSLAVDSSYIFAGTKNGIYRSSDNGISWESINSGLPSGYNLKISQILIDSSKIYIVIGGSIYLSTNNGNSWTCLSTWTIDVINAIAKKGSYIFASVNSKGVYRSTNNGSTWTIVNNGLPYVMGPMYFIYALATDGYNIYAGLAQGIYKSTDNGNSWTISGPTGIYQNVWSLHVCLDTIYAGTIFNGILISSDSGNNWTPIGPGNETVVTIAKIGNNIFASAKGGMCLTQNNGNNWIEINSGLRGLEWTSMTNNGNKIFAADYQNDRIFQSSDAGNTWSVTATGIQGVSSLASSGSNIYAGSVDYFYRSTDNGISWAQLNSGLPSSPRISKILVKDSIIFVGMNYYGVYKSSDNGNTWSAADSGIGTNISVNCFATFGSNIYAGIHFGSGAQGLYMSTNNGNSWTKIYHAHDVKALTVCGNKIFAGYSGGIDCSSDSGNNWTTVNLNLSNPNIGSLFTINNKIFAGIYGVGIYFSPDTANHWYELNDGLLNKLIMALGTDGNNIYAAPYCGGIWKQDLSLITGIDNMETDSRDNVVLYPNPASTAINIDGFSNNAMAEVYDISGKLLLSRQLNTNQIDISSLAKGLYFIKLSTAEGSVVRKFVKE